MRYVRGNGHEGEKPSLKSTAVIRPFDVPLRLKIMRLKFFY